MIRGKPQIMNFRDIASCKKDLDFEPEAPWPTALPPLCWQDWLISGFHSKMNQTLQLEVPSFHQAFQASYKSLSLPELARLYFKSQPLLTINWGELFKYYGFKDCENTHLTLVSLAQTPKSFQSWCHQKQVSPKDLAILRSLDSPIDSILSGIAHLNPSRSLGTQILHLACELHLMGHTTEPFLQDDPQKWYTYLRNHRYPHTSRQDQNLALKLKQLPWPSGSEVREIRHGDLSGFEIKLHIHSQKDFKKYLHGLHHVYELIDKKPDQLW